MTAKGGGDVGEGGLFEACGCGPAAEVLETWGSLKAEHVEWSEAAAHGARAGDGGSVELAGTAPAAAAVVMVQHV